MASSTEFTLSVRFNSSIPRNVKVDKRWTVLRLKEEIAKVHEVPVEDIKLVFQGKHVDENMLIEVIHIFVLTNILGHFIFLPPSNLIFSFLSTHDA